MYTRPLPRIARSYDVSVSRSSTDVVDVVPTVAGSTKEAAFAAIREVRRTRGIPSNVALFATAVLSNAPSVGDRA